MKILKHLSIWVAVSILAHLILFRFLRFESTQVEEGQQKYEVRLVYYTPAPVAEPKKVKPKLKKREEKPAPRVREEKKEEKEVSVQDVEGEVEKPVEQGEEEVRNELSVQTVLTPVESSPSRDLLEVVEGLRKSIMEHQVYPPSARKRSLQGIVILWLELDASGNLVELRVIRSSGHPILDRAAQALVKKVVPYKHGTGNSVSVEIPIKYSLVP